MAGDLAGAEAIYEKVLAREPRNAEARNLLGVVALQRGDFPLSVRLIREAIDIDGGNAGFFNNLGQALQADGDPNQAAACYGKALEIASGDPDILNNLGTVLHELGRLDDAKAAYDEALSKQSNDPEIHHNHGALLHHMGLLDDAVAAFRRALALNPNMESTYLSLGGVINEAGDREAAIGAYTRAIELNPLFTEAHDALKLLYWDAEEFERMDESFYRVSQALPQSSEAHCNLGRALIESQKPEDAETALRQALKLDGNNAEAHHHLGRVYAMGNQWDDAISEHREATRLNGGDAVFKETLGDTLTRAGKFSEAIEELWKGHEINPRRSGILAALTIAMNEVGDPRVKKIADYGKLITTRLIECPPSFDDLEAFNDALHAELEKRHVDHPPPPGQTMHGGTQIPTVLFANPTGLTAVAKEAISSALSEYIGGLESDPDHPFLRFINPDFRFTGAWSTILRGAGYDASHIHNEGWISGVYYVKVPDIPKADWDAGEGCLQIGEPPLAFVSERNQAHRLIRPQVGMAVFFPSYFWHGVKPFTKEGLRHSIAFDIL